MTKGVFRRCIVLMFLVFISVSYLLSLFLFSFSFQDVFLSDSGDPRWCDPCILCTVHREKKIPVLFPTSTSTPRIHNLFNSSPSTNELRELGNNEIQNHCLHYLQNQSRAKRSSIRPTCYSQPGWSIPSWAKPAGRALCPGLGLCQPTNSINSPATVGMTKKEL